MNGHSRQQYFVNHKPNFLEMRRESFSQLQSNALKTVDAPFHTSYKPILRTLQPYILFLRMKYEIFLLQPLHSVEMLFVNLSLGLIS
jgi:hypothetical protein